MNANPSSENGRSWIIWPEEHGATDSTRVGGKGAQLATLRALGLAVPEYAVIEAAAFDEFVAADQSLAQSIGELARCEKGPNSETLTREVACTILEASFPEHINRDLRTVYRSISDDETNCVAVRSSGVDEDGKNDSFAGLFQTSLYLRTEEQFLRAVREGWSSAFSQRALSYRTQRNASRRVRVALLVQRMLDPDAAGVVFSADPTSGDRDVVVIASAFGCGEGVVQGTVQTDTFKVHGERVCETRAVKQEKVVGTPSGGSATVPVPEQNRAEPSLSTDMARQLALAVRSITRHAGCPQDVEWARVGETLFFLQTRPITALPPPPARGTRRLWDNSNIVESYPGITTPLTYSFARRAYTIVYQQFCQVMGISRRTIEAHDSVFQQMIGLIRGRIYYNLYSWYQVISLLPGYDANREFMEQMMGVSEAAQLDTGERIAPGLFRRLFVELPRSVYLLLRLLTRWLTIDKMVSSFRKEFDTNYEKVRNAPMERLDLDELEALTEDLETRVLRNWKAPIVTDFFAMIFYGLLRKMCAQWLPNTPSLQNDLLSHIGNVLSAEPAHRLMAIATRLRADPQAWNAYKSTSDQDLWGRFATDSVFEPYRTEIQSYLDDFGDRCMEELKLETVSLRDEPSFVFASIRGFLDREDVAYGPSLPRAAQATGPTERDLRKRLGRFRCWAFMFILQQARKHIRNRESMRLARSKIFGIARRIYLAAGSRLTEMGALDEARDVLYLEVDDVWNYTRGTQVSSDLRALVRQRRKEFQGYAEGDPPALRFTTRGPPDRHRHAPTSSDAPATLHGTGACPGLASGPARVVLEPRDARICKGEILVAAHTDPGWVPLFASCSGLLVERGSLLSHSAIVAREFGIPTVVGVEGLLSRVRSGDQVELDGSSGDIRVNTANN